jgi:hypothetical protein
VVALAPARFQEAHNFHYPPRAKSYTNFERSITVPLVPLAGAPRDAGTQSLLAYNKYCEPTSIELPSGLKPGCLYRAARSGANHSDAATVSTLR